MPTKTCTTCGHSKDVEADFYRRASRCKDCTKAARSQYVEANRDIVYATNAERNRRRYADDPEYRAQRIQESGARAVALRLEVFTHYCGGETPSCACCREAHMEFLQLDHINGGGSTQFKEKGSRGSVGVLYWCRRNGYPEGYRVLCANCNFSLGKRGYCPHQRE